MILTNGQIYNYSRLLIKFNENFHSDMSVVINYYIQSNISKMLDAGAEVEKSIIFITNKYKDNQQNESGMVKIKDEYIDKAQKELDDLSNIKQNIDIHFIKLSDLKDIHLSTEELQAILFMIEDDLSETKEDK